MLSESMPSTMKSRLSDVIFGHSTKLYTEELEFIRSTSRMISEEDWKQNSMLPTGHSIED